MLFTEWLPWEKCLNSNSYDWFGCAAKWLQCLGSMHGARDTYASDWHLFDCNITTQKIRMGDGLPCWPVKRPDLASKLCDSDSWVKTQKEEGQECSKAQGIGWAAWWFEWERPPPLVYIWMSGFQLVDCLRRIRRCHLIGGGVSLGLGFEASKTHDRFNLALFLLCACGSDVSSQLLLQYLSGCHSSCHDSHGLTTWNCKQAQVNTLSSVLPWSWYLFIEMEE